MTESQPRPQDRLRLRDDAPRPEVRLIEPRSVALWTLLSLPLVGYFFWYYFAHRDCSLLAEDDATNPWFWLAMIFPGMVLVIPYAAAQAKIVGSGRDRDAQAVSPRHTCGCASVASSSRRCCRCSCSRGSTRPVASVADRQAPAHQRHRGTGGAERLKCGDDVRHRRAGGQQHPQ